MVWFVFLTDETVLPFLSGTVFRYCLTSIVGQFAKANAAFQNFKTIDTTLQARVSVFFLRNKMRNKAPRKKLCTSERVDIPPLHYMIVEDSRCFQGCFFCKDFQKINPVGRIFNLKPPRIWRFFSVESEVSARTLTENIT